MISLAGAIEASPLLPSAGYDMFLRATHAITRHAEDVSEAFRRMVFNVLACNRDDHTRQHSYLMSRAGEWRLAPAYDLTFSLGPGGEHYMDIEGEGRNPTQAHVEASARFMAFQSPRSVSWSKPRRPPWRTGRSSRSPLALAGHRSRRSPPPRPKCGRPSSPEFAPGGRLKYGVHPRRPVAGARRSGHLTGWETPSPKPEAAVP